jgi:outer membrane immunogenic protein
MITCAASLARDTKPHPVRQRHLHRIVGLALAGTLATGSALAADMPMKAPAAPTYQWSGCYVGLNAGGGGSASNFSSTVDPGTYLLGGDPALVGTNAAGSHNDTDFLGGGQAGCNLQSGLLVFGLEGDFDYFHSNPTFTNGAGPAVGPLTLSTGVPFTVTQSLTTNYLAIVRPRIGVAADRNFAYITGGAAFTTASYTRSYADGAGATGIATGSKFLTGWTAGAGWEYAWADHWTFKLEYLLASFPTTSALGAITEPGVGANTLHGSADLVIQLVRAGVNFKF